MGKQAASSSCFLGITILQQDYNYNHMKPHISWGKHLVSTRQLPGQTQWLSVSCGIDCLWVYDSLWVIFWLGLNPISYQYPINILSRSYQYPFNILSISSYIFQENTRKQTTGPGPPQLLESVTQPSAPSSWARAWMRSMPWSHTGKFVDSVDPTFFSTCYNWRAHWSSAMLGCLEWQPHCVWCVWFRMIY